MLLIGTNSEQGLFMKNKYANKFNYIELDKTKQNDNNYIVNYIETVKTSMLKYEVTYIDYNSLIVTLFNKLGILYSVICDQVSELKDLKADTSIYIIQDNSYEKTLYKSYNWIEYEDVLPIIPDNKNKLTFEQLLDENVNITEADERSLKETQNKLKVGMLLQAKNSLKRILKLTNILDKLYDEIVNRMEYDITTTDTASLMYSADYISKALQDTNKLIMDLINNDKIQNFFIIDNSKNINVNTDSNILDANSREKIRTAANVILNNLDYFQNGQYDKFEDPNAVIVENVDDNVDNDKFVEGEPDNI